MRTEYMNSCFAVCAGTKNFTMGRCQWEPRADCICNKNYSPVCVAGWRTYGNRCAAQCEGFAEFTIGKC
jgi:hypothetical protein